MLGCALTAEVEAITDYTTRIGQAEVCGELGLKVELEKHLADETRHKDELERIIAGCSLPDMDRYALPHVVGATSIGGGFDHDR